MGLAAQVEVGVEEQVARLESDVSHIRSDIVEIKHDVRGLHEKIGRQGGGPQAKFDGLMDAITGLRVEMRDSLEQIRQAISQLKIWVLLMGAAILGVAMRGFHWI